MILKSSAAEDKADWLENEAGGGDYGIGVDYRRF